MVFDVEAVQPDHDIELGGDRYVFWRKINCRRLHAGRLALREERHSRKGVDVLLLKLTCHHAGCSASATSVVLGRRPFLDTDPMAPDDAVAAPRRALVADLDITGVAAGTAAATVLEVTAAPDLSAQILITDDLTAAAAGPRSRLSPWNVHCRLWPFAGRTIRT